MPISWISIDLELEAQGERRWEEKLETFHKVFAPLAKKPRVSA